MNPNETNTRSDVNKIIQLLDKLKKSKKLDYEIVDTSKMTEKERQNAYGKVIGPSVYNKYEVRRVFGTNRQSGLLFGKEQPALLVEGDVWEIFPHRKSGREVSIEKFLENLSKSLVD
ncbi:MAG: hypothetical protein ACRDFB_09320 [Rhabdochlamydiaceae bacterium]